MSCIAVISQDERLRRTISTLIERVQESAARQVPIVPQAHRATAYRVPQPETGE